MANKQKSKSDDGFLNDGEDPCDFEGSSTAVNRKQIQTDGKKTQSKKRNSNIPMQPGSSTDRSQRPLVGRAASLDYSSENKQRPKSQCSNKKGKNTKDKFKQYDTPQGSNSPRDGVRNKHFPSAETSNSPRYNARGFTPLQKNKSSHKSSKFEPYISLFEVQQGLKRGEFIEGALRINPRSYEDAYINGPEGEMDIYIGGMRDRNRALNGDLVAVKINPKQEWKVLCDAIKDYHQKHGHTVIESVYSPVSTPCKVHTPEKFSKNMSKASSLWNEPGNLRMPDSLEIIGVDKLADELQKISVKPKKNRSKRCRKRSSLRSETSSQESNNQPSSTSHASSEDILGSASPEAHAAVPSFLNPDSVTEIGLDLNHSNKQATDSERQAPNGTHHSSSSWEADGNSSSIFISPEMLLDFGQDNPIQQFCSEYEKESKLSSSDESYDDSNVVVVAPHDLSGDEFTDSVSTVSPTHHGHLEDIEFFESQQDTQNNNIENVDLNNSLCSWPISVNREEIISNSFEQPTREYFTGENDCRKEIDNNEQIIPPIEVVVNSHSLVISERQNRLNLQTSPDNIECVVRHQQVLPQLITQAMDTPAILKKNSEFETSKPKKRKKIKGNRIVNKPKQPMEKNMYFQDFNIESLTVEQVMQHAQWPKFVQKTGKVVHILERNHSQVAVGHIKLLQDRSTRFALFSPKDNRLPRFMVPMSDCPQNFHARPQDFAHFLFLAKMEGWHENTAFPSGRLIKTLGDIKEIGPNTEGMLMEHGVECGDFSSDVISCLPNSEKWSIPKSELSNRTDCRKKCLFTIDPPTARDMDDAVSCEKLQNGNYEIGVHIADVSYFVCEGSPLDETAKMRATSVYLVQKVIPMLPRVLCDHLCSLTPGQDRLAFSVFWEISPDAEILGHKIERSVINSCIKLSYDHAQDMIDNPNKQWRQEEYPLMYGRFHISDVVSRVLQLNAIAVQLRKKRFDNGALRLDQIKLQFALNEKGLPSGFSVYEQRDSNKLIEELMLLANITVAKQIYDAFPHLAVLRRHPPPQFKPMEGVVKTCAGMGIHLDASNSGTLQSSILNYFGSDELSLMRVLVLTHLCSKPMNCARYFCSGIMEDIDKFHHYALSVPLYTHFTSPIRRYPDILVHRLLGASLHLCPVPMIQPVQMKKITDHCNLKKQNAKRVSELSDELFLASFLQECGPVNVQAMVISVMDHSFDCLVYHYGIVKRVYCDKLKQTRRNYEKIDGVPSLTLIWQDSESDRRLTQKIIMFAIVDLSLHTSDEMTIFAKLHFPPKELQTPAV